MYTEQNSVVTAAPMAFPSVQPSQLLRPEIDHIPANQNNYALLQEATSRVNNPSFVGVHDRWVEQDHQGTYSMLSGRRMSAFEHSNMVPFISSKQAGGQDSSGSRVLETYTGTMQYRPAKHEVESFYDQRQDITTGMPSSTDFAQNRVNPSGLRNGVLPFQQERVGPGIGLGADDGPSGGYQQFEIQEYARPKTVDELRIANNPKISYEAPLISGQLGRERAVLPVIREMDDPCEIGPSSFVPNAGPYTKPAVHGEILPLVTNRGNGAEAYLPPASTNARGGNYENYTADIKREDVEPNRNIFMNPLLTNGAYNSEFVTESFFLPPTLKEVCADRTVADSFMSVPLQALLWPVFAVLNSSKKALALLTKGEITNMNPQLPSKLTLRPTDAVRTTLKETTIHDATATNLTGHKKGPVMDTTQPARTTLKETLIHDTTTGQIGNQPQLGHVYDSNEVARVTGRETLKAVDFNTNLQGDKKGGLRPVDKMRVTVKETLVHTPALGAALTQGPTLAKMLPKIVQRLTQRQTTTTEYYGSCKDVRGPERAARPQYVLHTTKKEITSLHQYFGTAEVPTKASPDTEAVQKMRTNDQREVLSENRLPTLQGVKTASGKEVISLTRERTQVSDAERPAYQAMPTVALGSEDIGVNTKDKGQLVPSDRIDPDILTALESNPFVIADQGQG